MQHVIIDFLFYNLIARIFSVFAILLQKKKNRFENDRNIFFCTKYSVCRFLIIELFSLVQSFLGGIFWIFCTKLFINSAFMHRK